MPYKSEKDQWAESEIICDIKFIPQFLQKLVQGTQHYTDGEWSIYVQGARGPSLSSTWCVSQMASVVGSAPSSLGLMGAARLRKSCRIFNETMTSASSSFWGITLMKKPILLDFLKATTLWKRQRDQVHSYLMLLILCVCVCARARINLLRVILEVLRFSQFIILSSCILSSQHQFFCGY